MIRIYNSLTAKKEPLPKPRKGKRLRLFVCGPTVYDYAHIGHARTYIFFDVFARYLRAQEHTLWYIQNITDIEDKIITRARAQNKSPMEVARLFQKEYLKDMKTLGILSVNAYAPATKFIREIVRQVIALKKKGYAYIIEGEGYYFDIAKFSRYGILSRRTVAQAQDATSRIDESVLKKNKGDFALWKSVSVEESKNMLGKKFVITPEGEPAWNTPLGWGRPGWHIEDTAISEHYFGSQYEIHGGGIDLKFPHHEAEIAQQEAASGKHPFVNLWMHTGMLLVEGEKMSKSAGNFITIRELLADYSPSAFRLFVLQHHYRSPMNCEHITLRDAEHALHGICQLLAKLDLLGTRGKKGRERINLASYKTAFNASLQDDINTPAALAQIFLLAGEINKKLWQLSPNTIRTVKKFVEESCALLGIMLPHPALPRSAIRLAEKREYYRTSQQFTQADALRKTLEEVGYTVEDTPIGPFLWPSKKK